MPPCLVRREEVIAGAGRDADDIQRGPHSSAGDERGPDRAEPYGSEGCPGASITVLGSTGSTNADMLDLARAGAGEGRWLRAHRQTAGRGRLGRAWQSPPGNLYATTLVRLLPADPPAASLALVAGVALAEAASAYVGTMCLRLKWPNDLVAGGAKLAGILMEREGDAVVIGFGCNLASHPDLADRPTTSLAAEGHAVPDPQAFCLELAEAFARWLARWRTEGLGEVRGAWLARAHAIGTPIAFTGPRGRMQGLFDGLEDDGALRLRRVDGGCEVVRSGDVALL